MKEKTNKIMEEINSSLKETQEKPIIQVKQTA